MRCNTDATGEIDPASLPAPHLRPMRFDDYEGTRALLVDHAMGPPSFEEWRHRWVHNPLWQGLGRAAPIGWVLETAADEIVGSIETIPTLYTFRNRDLIAAVSSAWCVKAAYRGYALQLLSEYFDQPVDLHISTTVGQCAVETLNQFYGPIPLGEWDTVSYFITNPTFAAKRALQRYQVPLASVLAYPAGLMLWFKDALAKKDLPPRLRSVVIESIDNFDARFDDFWNELVKENPDKLLADRSRRALSWHFDGAVRGRRLEILTATKLGRLRGYCVIRHESWLDGQKAVLVDYQTLERDEDLLSSFLREALKRSAANGSYALQNFGVGVPKMAAFDRYAPYRRKLANSIFYYRANEPALQSELRHRQFWDPSLFDGDYSL